MLIIITRHQATLESSFWSQNGLCSLRLPTVISLLHQQHKTPGPWLRKVRAQRRATCPLLHSRISSLLSIKIIRTTWSDNSDKLFFCLFIWTLFLSQFCEPKRIPTAHAFTENMGGQNGEAMRAWGVDRAHKGQVTRSPDSICHYRSTRTCSSNSWSRLTHWASRSFSQGKGTNVLFKETSQGQNSPVEFSRHQIGTASSLHGSWVGLSQRIKNWCRCNVGECK